MGLGIFYLVLGKKYLILGPEDHTKVLSRVKPPGLAMAHNLLCFGLYPYSRRPEREGIFTVEPKKAEGRILVMDDEEFIRNLLANALGVFGFKALVSSHGAEAIELFELAQKSGRPFDGLIMDIHIKNGLGGVETISSLLKLDKGVRAIVSSADTNHPAMRNYKDYGFKSVLPKPYSLDELQKEVLNLIQKKA